MPNIEDFGTVRSFSFTEEEIDRYNATIAEIVAGTPDTQSSVDDWWEQLILLQPEQYPWPVPVSPAITGHGYEERVELRLGATLYAPGEFDLDLLIFERLDGQLVLPKKAWKAEAAFNGYLRMSQGQPAPHVLRWQVKPDVHRFNNWEGKEIIDVTPITGVRIKLRSPEFTPAMAAEAISAWVSQYDEDMVSINAGFGDTTYGLSPEEEPEWWEKVSRFRQGTASEEEISSLEAEYDYWSFRLSCWKDIFVSSEARASEREISAMIFTRHMLGIPG